MMGAGALREVIEIRRFTATPTGKGGQTRAWATLDGMSAVRAEATGQSGREAVIAHSLQGIETYLFRIHWRATEIRANDQIVWKSNGNRELNILMPPQDRTGSREWLFILADTSSPQGAGA
jgi:head-tail adaptor